MKKHISLLLLTASLTALPVKADNETTNAIKIAGSLAKNAILTSAGLTACAFSALAAHSYTAARLVNTDAFSNVADNRSAKRMGEALLFAKPVQNGSAFIGSVTGIAGATAVFNGVRGLVKDIKKLIHYFNGTQEPKENSTNTPEQSLSHSKKLARIALHTTQLVGGMGATALGTFTTVGSLVGGAFAIHDGDDLNRAQKRAIKAGMGLGTSAGLGLSTAGIASMVYGIKGLYNDYKQL